MNRIGVSRNLLVWCALGISATVAIAQPPPNAPFLSHKLQPNLYWVEGSGGNSTVIVGANGVIVVDAKTTKAGGQQLLASIAKNTPKPVTTVIETHSDDDHVNGIAAFPAGVKIIAHENNMKEQEAALAGGPGVQPPDHMPPPSDRLPTQVVSATKTTLTVDGEKLELYHWAPAHTSGDLVVYLPKYKIVATGDIIDAYNPYPHIHDDKHGSCEGWLTTARGIAALDATTFIPGHGNLQTRADIEKRISDAQERYTKVKELVAQGKSLAEVQAAVGDNNKQSWTVTCYNEMTRK